MAVERRAEVHQGRVIYFDSLICRLSQKCKCMHLPYIGRVAIKILKGREVADTALHSPAAQHCAQTNELGGSE